MESLGNSNNFIYLNLENMGIVNDVNNEDSDMSGSNARSEDSSTQDSSNLLSSIDNNNIDNNNIVDPGYELANSSVEESSKNEENLLEKIKDQINESNEKLRYNPPYPDWIKPQIIYINTPDDKNNNSEEVIKKIEVKRIPRVLDDSEKQPELGPNDRVTLEMIENLKNHKNKKFKLKDVFNLFKKR